MNTDEYRKLGIKRCECDLHATDEAAMDLIISSGMIEGYCLGSILRHASRFPRTGDIEDLRRIADCAHILAGIAAPRRQCACALPVATLWRASPPAAAIEGQNDWQPRKGDRVIFADGEAHAAAPNLYPPAGTVGVVEDLGSHHTVWVQWPRGATSLDDRMVCDVGRLRPLPSP